MKTRNVMLCMLIFILSATLLFAQSATEKGRILIDGSLSISSGSSDNKDDYNTEVDASSAVVDFQIGYMVIDDLEIGITLGLDNESMDIKNEYYTMETTDNVLLYGLFARYYFMKGKALRPFAGIAGGLGNSKITATGAEDMKYGVNYFDVGLGAVYFINEHWGIELIGNYKIQSLKEDDNHIHTADQDQKGFYINVGTIISF